MTNVKMTNKVAIEMAIEMAKAQTPQNVELIEKLEKIKASFEKKNSTGERKPTERQIENNSIKERVLGILGNTDDLMTITDLIKALGTEFGEISNQRMSAIVRQMYLTDGTVVRVEDKRKAFFKIA